MPRDAYLESRILSADPVELIHILYEHTLTQVTAARSALAAGDVAGRGRAITKALEALGELEGSLNLEAGGSIGQNLAKLYRYMRKRLTAANLKRDDEALAEVESLMRTLDEGWTAMQHKTSFPREQRDYHAAAALADYDSHSWSA
jgi:flagellar secretion chaperone FliS